MNRNYAAILLAFAAGILSFGATAQITIQSADFASAGDTVYRSVDFIDSSAAPAGGANRVWNFTALGNPVLPVPTPPDELIFSAPAAGVSVPPGTNLTLEDGGTIYMSKTATQLSYTGIAFDGLDSLLGGLSSFITLPSTDYAALNPALPLIKFPATYNSSYTATSESPWISLPFDTTIAVPGFGNVNIDSVRAKLVLTSYSLIDGWGSLQLPGNTFNVVRQRDSLEIGFEAEVYTIINAGPFVIPTWIALPTDGLVPEFALITHRYWANGQKYPVLEQQLDSSNTIIVSRMFPSSTPTSLASIKKANPIDFAVYPTPAHGQVTVLTANMPGPETTLELLDITGRSLKKVSVQTPETRWDVSNMSAGVYFVRLRTQAGQGVQKLIIE